jgi:hypothetical protein
MRMVLNTSPPYSPSFETIDKNLRRVWGIETGEELVAIQRLGRQKALTTTYNRLFEHVIKKNADFVLDYALLPAEALKKLGSYESVSILNDILKYRELSNALEQGSKLDIAHVTFSNPTPEFVRAIDEVSMSQLREEPVSENAPSLVTLPYSLLEEMTAHSWATSPEPGDKWFEGVREMFQKGSSRVTLLDDKKQVIASMPNGLWLRAFGIPTPRYLKETIGKLGSASEEGLISLEELQAKA